MTSLQRRRRRGGATEPTWNERLVFARTEDGLDLQGLLATPKRDPGADDVLCLWVHTRQLHFAEAEYVAIARLVAAAGMPMLTVNTRGQGFGTWFRVENKPLLAGSAWESFTDCVYDLDAWIDEAAIQGYRKILLVGHGFGGAKVLHFQAQRARPEVVGLVLASSGSAVRDKMSEDSIDLARQMAREGRGRDLMPWGTGGDSLTSTVSADWYLARAQMYKELYGHGALPPALARIRCPLFAWYGADEPKPHRNVEAFIERMRRTATRAPSFQAMLLKGVGFFYTGSEQTIARTLIKIHDTVAGHKTAA